MKKWRFFLSSGLWCPLPAVLWRWRLTPKFGTKCWPGWGLPTRGFVDRLGLREEALSSVRLLPAHCCCSILPEKIDEEPKGRQVIPKCTSWSRPPGTPVVSSDLHTQWSISRQNGIWGWVSPETVSLWNGEVVSWRQSEMLWREWGHSGSPGRSLSGTWQSELSLYSA